MLTFDPYDWGAHMSPEPFELFALRYANLSGRKASHNAIGGDPHEAGSDLDYFVWIAKRSDRTFVIDTGFAQGQADARKRHLIRSPKAGLALLGIDAAQVENVILTHLHYDHAGTLTDFPRACFHLQDAEMGYVTGRCMCHGFLRHSYYIEDVVTLVRGVHAGRVAFHDGSETLADGLTVHQVGGHTAGLQIVRVWTRRGWVVVASDASHLYMNFRDTVPYPTVFDVAGMLEGFRTVQRLADSPDHVVPGHDPLVMRLYPAVTAELEGIAVRLDVPPRTMA